MYNICMILTLHSQGEEIYYTSGGVTAPGSFAIGKRLEVMTGYKLNEPEGAAAYGGLTDWFIAEKKRPSYTIECGLGENPLPFSDFCEIYTRLRQALFVAPTLV
jgi:g-D-glutamyl-meso-diaminopimelate peptidase